LVWKFIRDYILPWGAGVLSFFGSVWQGAEWWQAGLLAGLLVMIYLLIVLGGAVAKTRTPTKQEVPASQNQETVSETQSNDPGIERSVRETRGVDIEDSKWQSKNTQKEL